MNDNYYLIPHIAVGLLALGFVLFILKISPGIRKMIKKNRKIRKRLHRIKEASKARDYQI
jgi:hypothetical protein